MTMINFVGVCCL